MSVYSRRMDRRITKKCGGCGRVLTNGGQISGTPYSNYNDHPKLKKGKWFEKAKSGDRIGMRVRTHNFKSYQQVTKTRLCTS